MVMYLGQGADLHMAQLLPLPLTISCSSESYFYLPHLHLAPPLAVTRFKTFGVNKLESLGYCMALFVV